MASMDVFKSDAFSMVEMTRFVNKVGYVPQFLDSLPGIVEPAPVRTAKVMVEQLASGPALIQTTPRGTPPIEAAKDYREARAFPTVRIAKRDKIYAHEVQDLRAAGSLTEFQSVQMEVARRTANLRRDIDFTREYYKLGLVQGLVKDADGSTIRDWMTEFSQAQPAEVAFDLTNEADPGRIKDLCTAIIRTMTTNLQGLGGVSFGVYALCGDQFFDQLGHNKEVRETFLGWQEAARLRNEFGSAYGVIDYGNIMWINYRGNGSVAIATDKAKFFPVNAGIFQWARSPGEAFKWANSPGLEVYSWINQDPSGNDEWIEIHVRSYPLPICVQPSGLASGRAGS